MPERLLCVKCRKKFRVRSDASAKKHRCPVCGSVLRRPKKQPEVHDDDPEQVDFSELVDLEKSAETTFDDVAVGDIKPSCLVVSASLGKTRTVEISRGKRGTMNCTVATTQLGIPCGRVTVDLRHGAQIVKRVSRVKTAQQVNLLYGGLTIVGLFLFVIPGILFWFGWRKELRQAATAARVTIDLESRERSSPIRIYSESVAEYFGTRLGDPPETKRILEFFQNAGISQRESHEY